MTPSNNLDEATTTPGDPETPSGVQTLDELLAQDAELNPTVRAGDGDENTPLLRDELAALGDEQRQNDGEATGDGDEKAKPVKFNDLAGATGLELDDLYKLEMTNSAGDTFTIEELKDMKAAQDDFALRELQWEERRADEQAKLTQAQNELTEIIRGLPKGAVTPEVLAGVRARMKKVQAEERKLTLQVISEWKDEAVREKELSGMAEYLTTFGFPADTLGSIVDHRYLNLIRSSYLREQRVKAALARVTAGKPNATKPSKSVGKAPSRNVDNTPQFSDARNGLEAFFESVE